MKLWSDIVLPHVPDEDEGVREPSPVSAGDLVLAFLVPIIGVFFAIPQLLREHVGQGLALLVTSAAGFGCWWLALSLITS